MQKQMFFTTLENARHVSDLFLDPRNQSNPDFLLTAKCSFFMTNFSTYPGRFNVSVQRPCFILADVFLYLQLLLLFYSFLLSINILKSLLFKKKSMYLYLDSTTSLTIFQNQTSLLIFSTISHEAQK